MNLQYIPICNDCIQNIPLKLHILQITKSWLDNGVLILSGLFICNRHLHDRIISIRGAALAQQLV